MNKKTDISNIVLKNKKVNFASLEIEFELISPSLEYAADIWDFRQEIIEKDSNNDSQFAGCLGLNESKSPEEWINLCLKRQEKDWSEKDKSRVPSNTYFAARKFDNKIIGIIDLRHHINHPILGTWGGHCGYTVRPSERGKGYAKEMLKQNLNNAKRMKIEKFLITCHVNNIQSEKVIIANGGVFDSLVEAYEGEFLKRFFINLKEE